MSAIQQLLTDHIDIWTAAETEKRSGRGRASSSVARVYGIVKLRELILTLAVRGKLIPQDPSDEPASSLIQKIQKNKAKLISEGKIVKEKQLTAIKDSEKSFNLPSGWDWVRFCDYATDIATGPFGSMIHQSDYIQGGVPLINPSHMVNDTIVADESISITHNLAKTLSAYAIYDGDIVMARRGEVGRIALVTKNESGWLCGTGSFVLRFYKEIPRNYLRLLFRSESVRSFLVGESVGTTMVNLNHGILKKMPIGIPPLAEQHRIVAKVDELMALCDQLEGRHSNAADAHEQLVSHLLGTLTQSRSASDFNANWQRIAAHFDTLFTTEASIDALKQTLLQLAVMGKLVAQDANDEPASELLKRVQAEKAKLVAEGKIKKDKALTKITEMEKSFSAPKNWNWVRLNELLSKIGAGSTPLGGKNVYVDSGVPFLRSQNVWDDGLRLDDVAFIEDKTHTKMSGTHIFAGDLLFNITGASIGRCAIVPASFKTGNVSQHVTIIRVASNEILKFLHLVLTSKHVQQTVMDVQVGVSREGLSIGKLGQFVIPIPPLPEQHRIIAKVEGLMALCDQLKSRVADANRQQKKLADVLIEHAIMG